MADDYICCFVAVAGRGLFLEIEWLPGRVAEGVVDEQG